MEDTSGNDVSPAPPITEPTSGDDRSIGVTKEVDELIKGLAKHYGTTKIAVVEAALVLLQDRVDGIDAIQIPELTAGIADLEETVGLLLVHAEQLERLSFELAALETTREANA